MAELSLLEKVKMSLRITTDAFDEEITGLIAAAVIDLNVAGVDNTATIDPILTEAIKTYCRIHFGSPDDYDRLKASYDEQKAQLSMSTGYTQWTGQTS